MKKVSVSILTLGMLVLTSCNVKPVNSSSGDPSPSISSTSSSTSSSSSGEKPDYSKATSRFSPLQSVKADGNGLYSTPSIGDVNLLVLPIDFSDAPSSSLSAGTEGSLERIRDGFFGSRSDVEQVESLSSFYHKSSYGKLNLSGDVANWYRAPKTVASYKRIKDDSRQTDEIDTIIVGALNEYGKTHDLNKYDTNKDGIIDGVWLVYSADIDNSGESMFWAFTYWSPTESTFQNGTLDVQTYAWASYQFFDEGGYSDHPDAHTFIHETGHMLGLDDYYDYNSSSQKPSSPVGGLDMMDFNIGDHHAFSKYSLGWVEPEILKTSKTITLKPFTSSGECAIIPAPYYNGTSMSEYIILQYYTPDGLNKLDAETSYSGYPKMYTESGILAYHADQRIGKISVDSSYNYTLEGYIDNFENLKWTDDYFYDIVNSNTTDRSYQSASNYHHLVELMSGSGSFNYQRYGNNSDLFGVGSDLGQTSYSNFKWNDGNALTTSIKVDSMNSEGITITVTVK